MVDNLINRTLAWEDEKKTLFLYDGVSFLCICSLGFVRRIAAYTNPVISHIRSNLQVRLVSILEDYKLSRQQKEEEKRRYKVNNLRLPLYASFLEILVEMLFLSSSMLINVELRSNTLASHLTNFGGFYSSSRVSD